MPDTFSLDLLGRELDAARRSRSQHPHNLPIEAETDAISPLPDQFKTARSMSAESTDSSENVERPYPLCLLCLTRPPSAVLLPCCHLNLCYLCAPALMLRHKSALPSPSSSLSSSPEEATLDALAGSQGTSTRLTWNQVLAKATASHPKSRRLSMGGYNPTDTGSTGGEMCAGAVLPNGTKSCGMSRSLDDEGRIALADSTDGLGGCAKCLICRANVQGWLRVYTG